MRWNYDHSPQETDGNYDYYRIKYVNSDIAIEYFTQLLELLHGMLEDTDFILFLDSHSYLSREELSRPIEVLIRVLQDKMKEIS